MEEKRLQQEQLIRAIWMSGVAFYAPIAAVTKSKNDDEVVGRCGRAIYDGTLDGIINLLLGPKK